MNSIKVFNGFTKRSVLTIFVLALLVLSGCKTTAQISAPIEVSDGKSYYIHLVEKGETAYSISKMYECEINSLLAANPGSDRAIQEGQTLRVPVDKSKAKVTVIVPGASGFIEHEVERRETLFSLARLYNVDINDIAAANPGSDKGINKGQIIRIPVTANVLPAPVPSEPAGTSVKVHTVQQGETIYAISRQYNVPVEVILASNPKISDTLSIGQQINVPVRALPLEPNVHSPMDKPHSYPPITISGDKKESYSIGLMLPFMSSPRDTVGMTLKEKKLQSVAFQLYRGAMIAVDSLGEKGFSADIYTYDIADNRNTVRDILNNKELQEMDIIIGPAFRDPLQEVASWSATHGVHVVCPVSQANKVLLSSPNMSKAYPSELTMWEGIGTFVGKQHTKDNVILVTTKDIEDMKRIQAFRAAYLRQTLDSVAVFDSKNRSVSGLSKRLKSSGRNIVIVPTGDKMILTTLFNELNSNNTIVYGTEEWEESNVIEPQWRNKYHIRYPKAFYTDYSDPLTQAWIETFRKRFKTEPDEYGFLGYSMMLYYGEGLLRFGKQFPNQFGNWECRQCLSTDFDYIRTGVESGFENRHFYLVGTEDFELKQINK